MNGFDARFNDKHDVVGSFQSLNSRASIQYHEPGTTLVGIVGCKDADDECNNPNDKD